MISFGFRKFQLGTLFGIPLYLDWSTIFIALMFLDLGSPRAIVASLALVAVLLASIVMHELGHSLTARLFGCETRDITLTVIGGCASLERMPRKAWQEFLTAAAGPFVSFVLGFALLFTYLLVSSVGDRELGTFCYVLQSGGVMNIVLGLFNLLPGFPMDGGRIFRSIMRLAFTRAKATYIAMVVGRVVAVAFVVLPIIGITHIWIIPIGGSLLLRVLIAWMIWQTGYAEYRLALDEERFFRWTQADFEARVSPPPYAS